jgi:MFS family permease
MSEVEFNMTNRKSLIGYFRGHAFKKALGLLFRIINRDVFCLLFSSSLCVFSVSLWYNFFVLFLSNIGFTVTQIGVFLFLITIIGFFSSAIGGVLSDLIGRKSVLILTAFLLSLTPLFLLMKQIFWVLLAIVFYSFGSFGRRAAGRVLVGEKLPRNHVSKGMGVYFTLLSIVATPAALVGGILASINYDLLFFIASLLSFFH